MSGDGDTFVRSGVAAPDADAGLVGVTIRDTYVIEALLGSGAMGSVYRAHQQRIARGAAIKVLRPELTDSLAYRARFEDEAVAIARLSHDNVVSVFDFGEFDAPGGTALFLAMELVEGGSLQAHLDGVGAFDVDAGLALFESITAGVAEAHACGIVHRDIKPSNVLMARRATGRTVPKLADFGLARSIDAGQPHRTRRGAMIGTPAYMAPEQVGGHQPDARWDVYALGVLLFHCLSGRVPFDYDDVASVIAAHRIEPVPALQAVRPDVDVGDAVESLLQRMMAKAPESRPRDALVLLAEVERIRARRGGTARRKSTFAGRRTDASTRPAIDAASVQVGRRYAVLIGVDDYEDDCYQSLRFASRDAVSLGRSLESCGFDTVVLSTAAEDPRFRSSLANAWREIENLAERAGPEDTILLFFSGHGVSDRGKLYLLPRDGNFNRLRRTALPLEDVRDTLAASKAALRVVVLDACYAALEGKGLRAARLDVLNAFPTIASGWALLASSRGDEKSHEWPERGHGVFTAFLLEALSGAGAREHVTLFGASHYVAERVQTWAVESRRSPQTPVLRIDMTRDFVFRVVESGGQQPDPSADAPSGTVRRLVTAVVCELVEPDMSSPVAVSAVHLAASSVTALFDERGDAVATPAGVRFAAVFGVDGDGRDAAGRAVDAATAAVDVVAAVAIERAATGLALRVAIATGHAMITAMITGVGRGARISGHAVALARELLRHADSGQVVSSSQTLRICARPLGVVRRLSFRGRVEPFVVVGESATPIAQPIAAHVGRQAAVDEVRSWVARALDDQRPSVILVDGESGSGKSRFLRAVSDELAEQPRLPVFAFAKSRPQPRALIVDIVRDLLSVGSSDPSSEAQRVLQIATSFIEQASRNHGPTADAERLLSADDVYLIGRVLSLPIALERAPDYAAAESRTLERLERTALVRLLVTVAQGSGLVLVTDDLHDADAESLAMLREALCAAKRAPLVIVGSRLVTATEPPAWPKLSRAVVGVHHVELGALTADHCRALVAGLLPGIESTASLVDQIVLRSDGSPFFIEEMVEDLRARGYVSADGNGQWKVAESAPAQLDLPETVTLALQHRLNELSDDERRFLSRAAVSSATGEFWPAALSELLGADAERISDLVASLWERSMVLPHQAAAMLDGVEEYAFAGRALHAAAASGLADPERKTVHARLARWIASTQRAPSAPVLGLMAWHYQRASEFGPALEACVAGAARAESDDHLGEAIIHLRAARDLTGTVPTDSLKSKAVVPLGKAALTERIVDHLFSLGQYGQAALELTSADTRESTTSSAEFSRRLRLAKAWGFGLDTGQARPHVEWCTEHVESAPRTSDRAAAYAWAGWLELLDDRIPEAVRWVEQAERVLPPASDAMGRDEIKQRAVVHNVTGMIFDKQGRSAQAVREMERCLELNDQIGDLFGVATALCNLACARIGTGELDQARSELDEAISIMYERLHNRFMASIFLSNLAQVHIEAGRGVEAQQALDRASELEAETPVSQLRSEILYRSADAHRLTARVAPDGSDELLARAETLAYEALSIADANHHDEELAMSWRALALVHAECGRAGEAKDAFVHALQLLRAGSPKALQVDALMRGLAS